ncbi:unnamed protein product [Microthlaspi erraticum]|uniref:Uncharacterized protein n=1 Tax=Microthlaspi erraticum TaxID=1685480 RepID=A0A6D2J3Q8_9BRAS|nr:unnamed protein product [Microthlaspi erraticum]
MTEGGDQIWRIRRIGWVTTSRETAEDDSSGDCGWPEEEEKSCFTKRRTEVASNGGGDSSSIGGAFSGSGPGRNS